jgi:eukaryotic-like serine/threonine-protein kinase
MRVSVDGVRCAALAGVSSCERILEGRYALYGPIASGGMATVHFGRLLGEAGFARTVAIKRLHGELVETPEFVSTLCDEARLASRIRHPNVVATLDMVTDQSELFLVMEYVPGASLHELQAAMLVAGTMVAPKVATAVLAGVLHGLHAAHDATDELGEPLGIVHRDVSPQNVLVGADGLARLLDFGIAKGKGRLQKTRAGQLKGKVGYMPPEQILGEEPDRRSDVYSAAVVLWELLTGRRLFEGPDNFNLIPKIIEADLDPPSAIVPEVPRPLDAIVMRALNRAPDARYESARAFAVALEDAVGVATQREVGDWVQKVAAEPLGERVKRLRALERESLDEKKTAIRTVPRKVLKLVDDPTSTTDDEPTVERARDAVRPPPGEDDTSTTLARIKTPEVPRDLDPRSEPLELADKTRIDSPRARGYEPGELRTLPSVGSPLRSSKRSGDAFPSDRPLSRPIPSETPPSSSLATDEYVVPVAKNRWILVAVVVAALVAAAAMVVRMSG